MTEREALFRVLRGSMTAEEMINALRSASQVKLTEDITLSLTQSICGEIADEMERLIAIEKQPRPVGGDVHHHYHLAPNHVVERLGESMLIAPAPEKPNNATEPK